MTDLDKLIAASIAAVETGSERAASCALWGVSKAYSDNGRCWPDVAAIKAFRGSLDDAKALHDALLPGWAVANIGQKCADGVGGWSVWITGPDYLEDFQSAEGQDTCPARAWLLATLRAYRSQVQK